MCLLIVKGKYDYRPQSVNDEPVNNVKFLEAGKAEYQKNNGSN
ncbi:hypothetical protein [Mucilaginibacter paludis]|uniref:Uncharacterized protein n=1 Tax=Mucilaginibacter paludis DSM 18603 TaxID=714943 RepID=H1YG82_9SPHI|nr:hypothetical protein [Mucilaginibacter paludis]EHQ27346.1 hypothetical protein Mucpa_3242 [Mucilaginibacter paludis DSM 18603]